MRGADSCWLELLDEVWGSQGESFVSMFCRLLPFYLLGNRSGYQGTVEGNALLLCLETKLLGLGTLVTNVFRLKLWKFQNHAKAGACLDATIYSAPNSVFIYKLTFPALEQGVDCASWVSLMPTSQVLVVKTWSNQNLSLELLSVEMQGRLKLSETADDTLYGLRKTYGTVKWFSTVFRIPGEMSVSKARVHVLDTEACGLGTHMSSCICMCCSKKAETKEAFGMPSATRLGTLWGEGGQGLIQLCWIKNTS